MNTSTKVAAVLANIGAINWGLVAIDQRAELIQYLSYSWLITTVYAIVGLSGLYCLYKLLMNKK